MEYIKQTSRKLYDQIDEVFTEHEAWWLYKTAAYLETITWVGLVFGIVSKVNRWPLYDWTLPILGSIHGVVFIYYVMMVFFAHRSMKWTFWQLLWAELLCNVPFGALAFELYIVRTRKRLL